MTRMNDAYPQPPARDPRRPFVASPFTRLARTHAFSVGGDALFTVGLASSVFFAVPLGEARWKVGLYLLLTFLPFAVAAPLIGPVLDRLKGGRRWVIIGSLALRALLCVFIVRDLAHFTFYLEAFLMLVFAKAYLISRAAVVPTTVKSDQELVEANSKLSMLSGVAAVVAGVPAAILVKLGGQTHGPQLVVGVAAVVFAIGAGFATRLPKAVVAVEPAGPAEKLELRSAGIRLAASALELIRGAVGLLLLTLAFEFKDTGKPLWYLGAIGLMAQIGVLAGAALAPKLRQAFSETQIISGSLAVTMLGAFVAALLGGLAGACILSLILGTTSGTAKQAFDALVQRDAPDANRGRSFAKFETRFQLAWVMGAFVPVVIHFQPTVGFVLVGVLMAIGLIAYLFGQRRVAHGTYDWESPSQMLLREARRRVGFADDDPEGDAASDLAAASAADGRVGPSPLPPGWAPPDPTTLIGNGPTPLPPPPPAPAAPSRQVDDWTPPVGFVTHPLHDEIIDADPTTAAPALDATTVAPSHPLPVRLFDDSADQPALPFGPTDSADAPTRSDGPDAADAPTRPDAADATTLTDAPTRPGAADATTLTDPPVTEQPNDDDSLFAEPRWRDSRP